MTLTPTLASVEALFRKLERELYRAFHHRERIHKADHFFNFCITAHAMRDHFLERVGKLTPVQRQPYNALWAKEPLLVAAQEIANSTKHFTLRNMRTRAPSTSKTKRVRFGRNTFADIYVSAGGRSKVVLRRGLDIFVVLGDNTHHELYSFMSGVLNYWRTFLRNNGIRVRRQPFDELQG